MKTVEVPDDWCEDCRGTGKRTLHGIAITSDEFSAWEEDTKEAYFAGDFDTVCEVCLGSGSITEEAAQAYHEQETMMRAEAPHMFQ